MSALVFSRRRSRAGLTALVSLFLLLGTMWMSSAAAHAAATTPTTGCPTPEILGGMNALGATIATPGAAPRTLDASQATAFMQTWLAYSVYSNPQPPQEHPPANLPVSTLTVRITQDGAPGTQPVFYATDGKNVWVGAPAPAPVPPPPNDQKWIRAPKPAATIAAFNGTLAPVCAATSASTAPSSSTTRALAVKSDGASSDTATLVILVVVAVLVVAGAGFAVSRVRRRRAA